MNKSKIFKVCPICSQEVSIKDLFDHVVYEMTGSYLRRWQSNYLMCWCSNETWGDYDLRRHFKQNGGILAHIKEGIILGRISVKE